MRRSMELARSDGEERTVITVRIGHKGEIALAGHDLGPRVREVWGDDYEYGLTIASEDVPSLALALIAEHYSGDLTAVTRLAELAARHDVAISRWSF